MNSPRRWLKCCLVGFATVLIFALVLGRDRHMLQSKAAGLGNRMKTVVQQARTVCIGRFLIDVPVSAEVVFGPARVPVELIRMPGDAEKLNAAVSKSLEQIEKYRSRAYRGLVAQDSMLGKVIDGIHPKHKIVFGIGKTDGAFYNVQSFFSVDNDLFLQEYDIFGDGKRYEEAVRKLKMAAALIRIRSDDEIPSEPGLCVDGAFVAEPPFAMAEAVTLGIRLREFKDVHLSIEMTKKNYVVESDALEPRIKMAERDAIKNGHGTWYSAIKTIRRGSRTIGKWTGYEMLALKPAQEHEQESHEFVFLSQGEPKNVMLPVLEIEMHTGVAGNKVGGVRPSVTDEEALYLWDKVTSSIRPR